MDLNILLGAGLQGEANLPQKTVQKVVDMVSSSRLRIVQNIEINLPRSTRINNAEKTKGIRQKVYLILK